jgi:two-component system, LytTR family, response regulator
MKQTMQALIYDPSHAGHVRLSEVPSPVPTPLQALVEVHSVSLNFGEVAFIANMRKPGDIPGWDAAGIVVLAAADGSGPKQGARVTSFGFHSAWAELRAVDTSELGPSPAQSPKNMPPVIFVTAYDEYAVNAFELNAVDYVLKPFDEARLLESIERARRRIGGQNQAALAEKLEILLANQTRKWAERIIVRSGERYEFVPTESIDWIESANNYVQLHCGPKQYLFAETLTNLETRLDPAKFARIHRGRIVNTRRIVAVHPLFSGTYEMELVGGTRLTSGRQYKEIVQNLIHA